MSATATLDAQLSAGLITPDEHAAETAAKPAAKRTRKPAAKPANPALTPEQVAELEAKAAAAKLLARLVELKTAYAEAKSGEKKTKSLLKDAKLAWENSRVITSRVAYAVAMLKPNEEGKPNLSYAARELVLTDAQMELTGEARTKAQKSANATLRNYVNAGAALFEEGQDPENRVTEPDAVERKIVADAFKSGNVRNTVNNPGAGTISNGGGGDDDDKGGDDKGGDKDGDALTFDDLNGQLGRMSNTLKAIMSAKVAVTPEQARHAMAALGILAMTLSEYVGLEGDDDA